MSDKRIKNAFDGIRAEEGLKENTREYLRTETKDYRRSQPRKYRRLAMIMACLVVILTGAGGYGIYFTPVSAISIDRDSSIELGVNRFGKVVSVDNYHGGQEIKHLNYGDAVELLLSVQNTENNSKDTEEVFITVTGQNREQCQRMQNHLSTQTEKHGNIHCSTGDTEEVESASAVGLSVGKYRAYLELKQVDPTVSPEDVQQLTMRQIRDRITELSGQSTTGEKGRGKRHQRGHGGQ